MNSKKGKKLKIIYSILGVLVLSIFTISVISKENINEVNVNANEISNKKIGWGIGRNEEHEQPDVGVKNKELLEKSNGICLGNKEEKTIYLTFDEGYEAGYTKQMLEILKANNVKATFFITAHYLNTQEELVRNMIADGHIVGNHTVNHKSMPDLTEEEIKSEIGKLHEMVKKKFDYDMKYMRPPKGEFSERTLIETQKLNYITVMWSFAYEDWNEKKQMDLNRAKEKIIKNLHNGEIMLLHGNSKTNLNILDWMIKEVKKEGYEFKNLDEFK